MSDQQSDPISIDPLTPLTIQCPIFRQIAAPPTHKWPIDSARGPASHLLVLACCKQPSIQAKAKLSGATVKCLDLSSLPTLALMRAQLHTLFANQASIMLSARESLRWSVYGAFVVQMRVRAGRS